MQETATNSDTAIPSTTRIVRSPDILWIEIPEGEFIYGEGDQQTKRHLDQFWIAKYPITNVQFRCFIDDGGYHDDRWWKDVIKPEPEPSRWPQGNRPRTNVNWLEASAFTRWLSVLLTGEKDLIRLPTEHEWEKAARGVEGLVFPWGNEYRSGYANINETLGDKGRWNLQQTTAVGLYPHGRSPYDVEDLSGSVWEWCSNRFDEPDVTKADTSSASRVLRGGAWFSNSELARAVLRNWNGPGLQNPDVGFRVLSSVPIAVR